MSVIKLSWSSTLRKKYLYSEFFWSVFFRIRTEYKDLWSKFPYSVRMRKNEDQKNSEYGHFLRSARRVGSLGVLPNFLME